MVDPEIQTAIDIIDKKILSLQQARNQLALAFGMEQSASPKTTPVQRPLLDKPINPRSFTSAVQVQQPRKEALAEFLIKSGPMSRADIVNKAGLPEGTISYCLNDKRFFEQMANGDWDVTQFSRHGFELKSRNGQIPLPA